MADAERTKGLPHVSVISTMEIEVKEVDPSPSRGARLLPRLYPMSPSRAESKYVALLKNQCNCDRH